MACAARIQPAEHAFHRLGARAPRDAATKRKADVDGARVRDRRILVLEDEPLIAMMTSRIVSDLDAVVLGPFASAGEAQARSARRSTRRCST